jgi:putative ABC transport system permease protein
MPISAESSAHQGDASLHDRTHQAYRLFARLSPGASIGQAQAQMTTVARRLDGEHDARTGGSAPVSALIWPGSPFPLPLALYGGLRVTIALVMAAAALVLVVACANVASLQLARAGVRHAELRTRVSLGATRSRLIRQLLTESALLGVASGALALAAAWAMLRIGVAAVANVLPPEYGSLVFDVTPDPQIFAFVVAISLAAALLFGLAPAFDGSRSAAASGARATTASRRTRRLQNALVGSQVALSLVLAITGGVLIQAARHSLSRETGYDAGQVADLEIQFSDGANEGGARGAAVTAALRVRVQGMPGVISVTSARPPDDNRFVTPAVPVRGGASTTAEPGATPLFYRFVEPGYFQTLGIPIVLGHVWPRGETSAVAILSESAAKRLWPNEDPIGRRVRLGVTDEQLRLPAQVDRSANGLTYEVVGVARDTRGAAFDGGDSRQVYVPLSESQRPSRALLIRFAVDSASLVRQLGPLATTLDPSLVATASTLQDHLKTSAPFIVSSLSAAVASTMGLLGLLLASMGIYGTVNYIVLRRTREVGIRIAVGARPSDVLSLILGESARPVIAGIAVGLVVAASALRLVDGMFFGLGSMDVPSFAGVTAFFIAVALAAALPPARRALRIDPVEALRAD